MKDSVWILITIVVSVLAFIAGYNISSRTGVEPGYFETAEAGGYGAGSDEPAAEGVSQEMQDYYDSLMEDK